MRQILTDTAVYNGNDMFHILWTCMQDVKADRYCTLVYNDDDMFHILWMCMQDIKAGIIPAIYSTTVSTTTICPTLHAGC